MTQGSEKRPVHGHKAAKEGLEEKGGHGHKAAKVRFSMHAKKLGNARHKCHVQIYKHDDICIFDLPPSCIKTVALSS